MAWPDRRRMTVRGSARRLRRWAATAAPPLDIYLDDLGWDWWPVSAAPWNAMPPPRPTGKALRAAVETFSAERPCWAEAGRRWHAAHPDEPPPVTSLWIVPTDLYRCELRLEVGDRARVFREEWAGEDRPDRPVPPWLASAAPGLVWRPAWRWEAWHDDEIAEMTPRERRRLTRFGPMEASATSPGWIAFRQGVAWVGVAPEDVVTLSGSRTLTG